MTHDTHFWKSTMEWGTKQPCWAQATPPMPVDSSLCWAAFAWFTAWWLLQLDFSTMSEAAARCILYLSFPTMNPSPLDSHTSSSGLMGCRCSALKFPSITNDRVYFQLKVLIIAKVTLVLNNTHSSRDSSPDKDTLIPGWGQAGQNNVRSPAVGLSEPWPKPCHFMVFNCLHCLATLMSSLYQSLPHALSMWCPWNDRDIALPEQGVETC